MGAGEALKKCQVRNSRFGNFKIMASYVKILLLSAFLA
jgi:hypothetical protein